MENKTEHYIEYTRDEITLNVENNIDWYSKNLTLMKRVFELRDTPITEVLISKKLLTHRKRKTIVRSVKSILKSLNKNKNVSRADEKIIMDFTSILSDLEMGIVFDTSRRVYETQQEIDRVNHTFITFFHIMRHTYLYLYFKLNPEKNYVRYYPNVSNSTVSIHV